MCSHTKTNRTMAPLWFKFSSYDFSIYFLHFVWLLLVVNSQTQCKKQNKKKITNIFFNIKLEKIFGFFSFNLIHNIQSILLLWYACCVCRFIFEDVVYYWCCCCFIGWWRRRRRGYPLFFPFNSRSLDFLVVFEKKCSFCCWSLWLCISVVVVVVALDIFTFWGFPFSLGSGSGNPNVLPEWFNRNNIFERERW